MLTPPVGAARVFQFVERRVVPIQREVEARIVPTGETITIPSGVFVTLTQAMGGTYTVVHKGVMARIEGVNADALGFEPEVLEFITPEDGRIDSEQVWQALKSIHDPEIPVNIVDLGLVYNVGIDGGTVNVTMTLTSPGCGMGPVLVQDVEERLGCVPFVSDVDVDLVFDPPWSRDLMTEEAQLELGIY